MKIIMPDKSTKDMNIKVETIEYLLRELGQNPVEVIVAKNGKIVSELDLASAEDELRIIRVVHGG